MRALYVIIALAVIGAMLTGCGGEASSSTTSESGSVPVATAGAYTSTVLATGYENALSANSQLALGTLRLEGTGNAVTPAQAKTLLPLWQVIQNGVLQSDAEMNAVLKQIEGTMTAEQLAAIAAMQLTTEDVMAYAQESGLQSPGAITGTMPMGSQPGAGGMAAPPAGGSAQGQGGPGGFGNLSAEEQAAMRATAEAGGFGGGQAIGGRPDLSNMTDEQRAAMQATAEAGGFGGPSQGGQGFGSSQGSLTMLAKPLVDFLTQRAAE